MYRPETSHVPQPSESGATPTRPVFDRGATGLLVGIGLGVLSGLGGCERVRYSERFIPEGPVDQVVIQGDSGTIELISSDHLRVERAVRAPRNTLALGHQHLDGEFLLTSYCQTFIPCSVVTRIELPTGLPVLIQLDRGEVWATDIGPLTTELGEGTIDVDMMGPLTVRLGSGTVRATLPADGSGRLTVANGNIDVQVDATQPWFVDATAQQVSIEGLESTEDAESRLELVAPNGAVMVKGSNRMAQR